MRQEYIQKYRNDHRLRSSLELLKLHIFNTAWKASPATFSLIFIRLADRVLYHAMNVWEQFEKNLRIPTEILQQVPKDAVMQTRDITSKYEIEAYLAAAKALFEANLIGINEPNKQNLLGTIFVEDQMLAQQLGAIFENHKIEFFGVANRIRNHSYHVNSQLRDAGFLALVKQVDSAYVVTLPNIYTDEHGAQTDLAEIFISTHEAIEKLLQDIRDLLLRFFFQKYGVPANRTYIQVASNFGNMLACIGPLGFEFKEFENAQNEREL